jgi:hypothetical protein
MRCGPKCNIFVASLRNTLLPAGTKARLRSSSQRKSLRCRAPKTILIKISILQFFYENVSFPATSFSFCIGIIHIHSVEHFYGAELLGEICCINMHQHASICVNMRQHASTCVNMGQHASTCVNMRQHASTCINMHQMCQRMHQIASNASNTAINH